MINFLDIRNTLKTLASIAPRENAEKLLRRELALRWFSEAAKDQDGFYKLLTETQLPKHPIQCGLPAGGPMNKGYACNFPAESVSVLAVDGSSYNSDQRSPIDYAMVNIGVVGYPRDGGKAFQKVNSTLLIGDDLRLNEAGFPDPDATTLRRDVDERLATGQYAGEMPSPVICLTDGQLWLFPKFGAYPGEYQEGEERYVQALLDLAKSQVIAAGYVDKPQCSYLVRALELAHWNDDDPPADPVTGEIVQEFKDYHPLWQVRDADLFFNLLKPGERSTVFELIFSGSASKLNKASKYSGDIAIHFFYINVGRPGQKTALARVDVPKWVAENEQYLDMIQSVLLRQCRMSGSRNYPLILHRAHEAATYTHQDREQVEMMLAQALRERGFSPRQPSEKQGMKDVTRR